MKKMRFCSSCGDYTMEKYHCGKLAISAHPAPFNPHDRFFTYKQRYYSELAV
ncbi:MAG: nucleolar RNA-binding Nop10p family protein [Candidatus Micrarchaeota archaeon]